MDKTSKATFRASRTNRINWDKGWARRDGKCDKCKHYDGQWCKIKTKCKE